MENKQRPITLDDVNQFLEAFRVQVSVFGIVYRDDRSKNRESLFKLEINGHIREQIVLSLEGTDYSEGPIIDTLNNLGDMWVFGKTYNGVEIYIKISIIKKKALCISFHEAERPIKYPFK